MRRMSLIRHCGGRRLTRAGKIVVVHGGQCKSDRGICACPCRGCRASLGCPHERTMQSAGSIAPMGILFKPVARVRTVREDGTAYVGPGVQVRADPSPPPPRHWQSETCLDCGMTLRSSTLPP